MHVPGSLVAALSERWWVPLCRGAAAIIFGVYVLAHVQTLTLPMLAIAFGGYAIAEGLATLALALRIARANFARSLLLFFHGVAGISLGALPLLWSEPSGMLSSLIALWAVWTGTIAIIEAMTMRRELAGEWLHGTGGVISLCFGLMLVASPRGGALAMRGVIAAWALVFGLVLLGLSGELYRLGHLRRLPS